jgi:hypothetical protein
MFLLIYHNTTFALKFRDWSKTPSERLFPDLPNIYLSRGIKPVSELYGCCTYYAAKLRFSFTEKLYFAYILAYSDDITYFITYSEVATTRETRRELVEGYVTF